MFKKRAKQVLVGVVVVAIASLGAAPAQAVDDSYRIPGCWKGDGPGLKSWNGRSSQDGWNKWFYTKSGCTTAAVEHWGQVTGNQP